MRQALILAGGKGTRLKDRLGELPKPMIPIGGKPLLEHQIQLARHHGFTSLMMLAGYRAEAITEYFGDGDRWGVKLEYLVETTPRGTAGAVLDAWDRLEEEFLVIYGDEMLNVDLRRLATAHREAHADATLLLHPNNHPQDSDLVEVSSEGWVTALHTRPHPPGAVFDNLVNAALYVIRKSALLPWRGNPHSLDFGKDVFPAMLRAGARLLGYNSPEYIKDIGTPQRYDAVCREFDNGVIARSTLSAPQPAVFLDRDGTLNVELDGLTSAAELALLPGVGAAVRTLNERGIRAVVVTNQPVIAKGFCSEAEVQQIHRRLAMLLGQEHAFLDRIYYCPHHPEKGFPGERTDLKISCDCRKPGTGMIERAARELNLDLKRSWLVGDTSTDMQTARNAGLGAVLVRTGHGGRDAKYTAQADAVFETLGEALAFVAAKVEASR